MRVQELRFACDKRGILYSKTDKKAMLVTRLSEAIGGAEEEEDKAPEGEEEEEDGVYTGEKEHEEEELDDGGDSVDFSKLTVVVLRGELKKRGLDQTGNKPALVKRLSGGSASAPPPPSVPTRGKSSRSKGKVATKVEVKVKAEAEVTTNTPARRTRAATTSTPSRTQPTAAIPSHAATPSRAKPAAATPARSKKPVPVVHRTRGKDAATTSTPTRTSSRRTKSQKADA
jgi:hypothetical protein